MDSSSGWACTSSNRREPTCWDSFTVLMVMLGSAIVSRCPGSIAPSRESVARDRSLRIGGRCRFSPNGVLDAEAIDAEQLFDIRAGVESLLVDLPCVSSHFRESVRRFVDVGQHLSQGSGVTRFEQD